MLCYRLTIEMKYNDMNRNSIQNAYHSVEVPQVIQWCTGRDMHPEVVKHKYM